MMIKKYIWLTALFLAIPAHAGDVQCNEGLTCALDTIDQWLATRPIAGQPIITVWVHGTKLPPQSILYFFLYRKMGLHRALCYDPKYRVRCMAEEFANADPIGYPLDHIYIFGWTGFLNFSAREEAGRDLYRNLVALRNAYKKRYRKQPFLRVITHSHGGNVVLNLTKVKGDLQIDELIFLACPVQDETSFLISDPMFKRIYALYSTGDMLQVVDPQGLYKKNKYGTHNFFSNRRFPCEAENICQIQAKNRNATYAHIDFLRSPFANHLPKIIKECAKYDGKIGKDAWFSVEKIKQKCPRRYWQYDLIFEPALDE